MEIAILSSSNTSAHFAVKAACGRTTALVQFSKTLGTVQVIRCNAAHRAWKGGGRTFGSWDEALAAYKQGTMQAIIGAARDMIPGQGRGAPQ